MSNWIHTCSSTFVTKELKHDAHLSPFSIECQLQYKISELHCIHVHWVKFSLNKLEQLQNTIGDITPCNRGMVLAWRINLMTISCCMLCMCLGLGCVNMVHTKRIALKTPLHYACDGGGCVNNYSGVVRQSTFFSGQFLCTQFLFTFHHF